MEDIKLSGTIQQTEPAPPSTVTTTAEIMNIVSDKSVTSTTMEHDQSFCRMPSQRRRRLWTLAARAAARRTQLSHDLDLSSNKNLGEMPGSSFLAPVKPITVRTQDSGISSMDYVTSREINSPNSEEKAGSRRPRANTSASLSVCESRNYGFRSVDVEMRPRYSNAFLPPRIKLLSRKGFEESRFHPLDYPCNANTLRYTNFCNASVPEWVRRNWSSAPRPIIPRQRSSVETTSYDIGADWASLETLNMQYSLYPQNRRLYYERYGRTSCPKATFFDSSFNDPNNVHLEVADEAEEEHEETMVPLNSNNPQNHQKGNPNNLRGRRRHELIPRNTEVPDHRVPLHPSYQQLLQTSPPPPLPPRTCCSSFLDPECGCERPDLPMHACAYERASLHGMNPENPIFHCSSCPFRYLPHGMSLHHHATPPCYPSWYPSVLYRQRYSNSLPQQCDLPQRHVRRRMFKRMSSEPSPPTWFSASYERPPEVPPHKLRAPTPDLPPYIFSSPPLPKRQSDSVTTHSVYSDTRIIEKRPTRADVYLRTPSEITWQPQQQTHAQRQIYSDIIRGRSVEDGAGSTLFTKGYHRMSDSDFQQGWERPSSSFHVNEPLSGWINPKGVGGFNIHWKQMYPHIHEEGKVLDWNQHKRYVESAPGRISTLCSVPRMNLVPSSFRTRRISAGLPSSHHAQPPSEGVPVHSTLYSRTYSRRLSRNYARSASHSLHSFEAENSPTSVCKPLRVPPWQRYASSRLEWGRACSMNVSLAESVGSHSDLYAPEVGHPKCTIPWVPPKNIKLPADTIASDVEKRQDLRWKRKSFKRSNGYDAADTERFISYENSSSEDIELLERVKTTPPCASVEDDDRITLSPPPQHSLKVTENEDEEEIPSNENTIESVRVPMRSTLAMLPPGSVTSRTPSRASHLASRGGGGAGAVVVSALAALDFHNRNEYWEHAAFARARLTAISLAGFASICLLYSFGATTWVYSGNPGNVTIRGLWQKCHVENRSCQMTIPFVAAKDGWQGGATCILFVALCIGLMGTTLSIVGHSSSALIKRLYYFHSSGEIFFLAGFTTFLGVGIYRSYAHTNLIALLQIPGQPPPPSLRFGAAEITGWLSGFLFLLSSFSLLLDEFIHEAAKLGTRWPCILTLLRFGADQLAASRHCTSNLIRYLSCCCGCRGNRCCRKTIGGNTEVSVGSKITRQRRRATNVPPANVVYRPTTGQIISIKRSWRG